MKTHIASKLLTGLLLVASVSTMAATVDETDPNYQPQSQANSDGAYLPDADSSNTAAGATDVSKKAADTDAGGTANIEQRRNVE
ncbi:hypothetical protein GCM10007860_23800 [Chitiniphilus shinanonensis]|uniref:Secreted protein n=1 Tax=Chitiniphilus shinanonensis TaxID=553088 RepID=A0ABQ6BTA4_9NEIS|nr:hypothetical protein [Chitiniphilus shinanonensis]GLS05230.1 hypothetical protein GCM10007860_23800 [Chitiniphilus shinanonensis]